MAERERERDEHSPPSDISDLSLHPMDSLPADRARIYDSVLNCCEDDEGRAEAFRDRILPLLGSEVTSVDIAMEYEVDTQAQQETELERREALSKTSVQQWFFISENSINDTSFMLNVDAHLTRSTASQDHSFIPVWSKPKGHFFQLPFGLNAWVGVCATERDARLKRTFKQMLSSEDHQMKKRYLQQKQDIERRQRKEMEEIWEQEKRKHEEKRRKSVMMLQEDINTASLSKDEELPRTRPQVPSQPLPRTGTPPRSSGTSSSYPFFSSGSSLLPSSLLSTPHGSLPQDIHYFNITINNPQNVTIGGGEGVIADSRVRVHGDYLGAGNSGRDLVAGNTGRDLGPELGERDMEARISGIDFGQELSGIDMEGHVAGDSTGLQRNDCCDEEVSGILRATADCASLAKSIRDETPDESDTQLKRVASTTQSMESLNLRETGSPAMHVLNLSETGSPAMQVDEQIDSMTFSSSSFECIDHPTDGEEFG